MARDLQWQSASEEDWKLAVAREAVIRRLAKKAVITAGLTTTASAQLGISRTLLELWLKTK